MGNLLSDYPVVGPIAIIVLAWGMSIATALVVFMFENPDSNAATAIGATMAGIFGISLLNIRKLLRVE